VPLLFPFHAVIHAGGYRSLQTPRLTSSHLKGLEGGLDLLRGGRMVPSPPLLSGRTFVFNDETLLRRVLSFFTLSRWTVFLYFFARASCFFGFLVRPGFAYSGLCGLSLGPRPPFVPLSTFPCACATFLRAGCFVLCLVHLLFTG